MTKKEELLFALRKALNGKQQSRCAYYIICALLAGRELGEAQIANLTGVERERIREIAKEQNLPTASLPNIPNSVLQKLNLLDGNTWKQLLTKAKGEILPTGSCEISAQQKEEILTQLGLLNNSHISHTLCERIWDKLHERIDEEERVAREIS